MHTPGPWRAEPGDYPDDNYVTSDGGTIVDHVSDADARLIAAAPDLLDALMAVVKADVFPRPSLSSPLWDALDLAHAAVAKARGS